MARDVKERVWRLYYTEGLSQDDIAGIVGLSSTQVSRILDERRFQSLDDGDGELTYHDAIPDPGSLDLEDRILGRIDGERALGRLTLSEAEVVKAHAYGLTQQEIADNLGLTQQRVQQILSEVRTKLNETRNSGAPAQDSNQPKIGSSDASPGTSTTRGAHDQDGMEVVRCFCRACRGSPVPVPVCRFSPQVGQSACA